MIIAGETSGDLHGAALLKELLNINREIKFFGIGGDKMIAEGLNAMFHIKQMAFLGFVEVIRHIPFMRNVQKKLIEKIKEENIELVILIDYPGFNLSLAKKIKKIAEANRHEKIKIVYYISPQVWAWGKNRVEKIKKFVNKMLVVFPFEVDFYKKAGLEVEYTGHPLIDRINNHKFLSREELNEKFGLNSQKEILLLMPGSRKQEIKKIFPAVITAAEKLSKDFNLQIIVACPENIDESIFSSLNSSVKYFIVKGNTYDLLKHARFGVIKSGTSTLEAALLQMPFVVVYKTSLISYIIGRLLANVETIAMANIIAGEKIVEELIQQNLTPEKVYNVCKEILTNNAQYILLKNKLAGIKGMLGDTGASKRAAESITALLNES